MLPKSSDHGKVSMAAYYGRHAIVPLVKTYVAHGHSSDVTSSDMFNLGSKGFPGSVRLWFILGQMTTLRTFSGSACWKRRPQQVWNSKASDSYWWLSKRKHLSALPLTSYCLSSCAQAYEDDWKPSDFWHMGGKCHPNRWVLTSQHRIDFPIHFLKPVSSATFWKPDFPTMCIGIVREAVEQSKKLFWKFFGIRRSRRYLAQHNGRYARACQPPFPLEFKKTHSSLHFPFVDIAPKAMIRNTAV